MVIVHIRCPYFVTMVTSLVTQAFHRIYTTVQIESPELPWTVFTEDYNLCFEVISEEFVVMCHRARVRALWAAEMEGHEFRLRMPLNHLQRIIIRLIVNACHKWSSLLEYKSIFMNWTHTTNFQIWSPPSKCHKWRSPTLIHHDFMTWLGLETPNSRFSVHWVHRANHCTSEDGSLNHLLWFVPIHHITVMDDFNTSLSLIIIEPFRVGRSCRRFSEDDE